MHEDVCKECQYSTEYLAYLVETKGYVDVDTTEKERISGERNYDENVVEEITAELEGELNKDESAKEIM